MVPAYLSRRPIATRLDVQVHRHHGRPQRPRTGLNPALPAVDTLNPEAKVPPSGFRVGDDPEGLQRGVVLVGDRDGGVHGAGLDVGGRRAAVGEAAVNDLRRKKWFIYCKLELRTRSAILTYIGSPWIPGPGCNLPQAQAGEVKCLNSATKISWS